MNAHDKLVERVSGSAISAKDENIWLREGNDIAQTVIFAERADILTRKLFNTTFYIFEIAPDGTAVFERRLDAKEAELVTQGYWQLRNVIENAEGELAQNQNAVSLPTTISIEDMRDTAGSNVLPPFWDIPSTIREGGTLRLLIIGSILGFAVYFADNVVSAFGQASALPIILAAWACPLFVLFFGLSYLARIEDG